MFFETLRRVYPDLTKGQQVLAKFLVQNYHQAAFMTAARVAEAVSMNEATVVRFAQRLGYRGYPELQEAVQATVLSELEVPTTPAEATTPAELFAQFLIETSAQLSRATNLIALDQVEEAVAILAAASRVSIISAGEGIPLGQHMARRLRSLGLYTTTLAADRAELAQALAVVGPQTLVVGCAGARGSAMVAAALQRARRSGARTLALAHSSLAPEAHVAEVALTPPPTDPGGAMPTVVLIAMADALVEAAAAAMPQATAHRRQARELEDELEQGG